MPRYAGAWVEFDDGAAEYADPYPAIREVLSEDYADAAPETIERFVESAYPGLTAEDLEGFFSGLRRAGRSIGRVAKRALPGVIQGATTGAALGPWGALAGGLAGGALSAATSGGARGAPRRSGARPRLPARGMRGPAARSPAARVPVAGSPAGAQLLRTLARPEVGQALRSLAMGGAGRRNVNVGGLNIPTGAITNVLGRLLERAEMEMHAASVGEATGTPAYLLDNAGEYLVDPGDPDQRADLVLELFAEADALEAEDERTVEVIYVEARESWNEDDDAEDEDGVSLYEGVDYDAVDDEDAY
jgi:hypothetical protein